MGCNCCKGFDAVISVSGLDYVRDTFVYIESRDGEPEVTLEQDCGSVSIIVHNPINYCPMCGEKLRKESGE